jgi:6-phosphogluconolactonase
LNKEINVFSDLKCICEKVVDDWFEGASEALHRKTTFNLALSGGNTPGMIFQHLYEFEKWKMIPWEIVHIFWVDERCVPPDHSESNYRLACDFILNDLSIPEENIHRIRGENDPVHEAIRYEDEILKCFGLNGEQQPCMDWILLGVGADGHVASIFPQSSLEYSRNKTCGVATHPTTGQKRISISLPVINQAKRIAIIITGQNKADIVFELLNSSTEGSHLPAGKINPIEGSVQWLLDELAASQLNI